MKPCLFTLAGTDEAYNGWTDDTTWNGFTNVWVQPPTRGKIVRNLQKSGDDNGVIAELAALPRATSGPTNGLISLANGYATEPANITCDHCPNDAVISQTMADDSVRFLCGERHAL